MDQNIDRGDAGDIDVAAVWQEVVKGKNRLLIAVLAIGVLTFFILSLITPRYTSEARIIIENNETAYTRPAAGARESSSAPLDREAVKSQVQVLSSRDLVLEVAKNLAAKGYGMHFGGEKSSGLMDKVLEVLGLGGSSRNLPKDEKLINEFEKRLTVFQFTESRVIAVKFTSTDRKFAAIAANSLSDTYVSGQSKSKANQNKGASEWLKKEIDLLRPKVQEAEEKVENFKSSTDLQSGRNNVMLSDQQLSELNSQLILAKAQRTEAEARARQIAGILKNNGSINDSSDVLKSGLIQRLLEQRVQVQRSLAELSATLLPSHPRVKQLNSELSSLLKQIRKEAQKIGRSLKNEAQIAGAREQSLKESLNILKKKSAKANEETVKLRALQREAKANRDLLESYLARYRDASARGDTKSVPANARIISRAYPPNSPSFPKKVPMTLLAMAAAALSGLAYLVTRGLLKGAASTIRHQPSQINVNRLDNSLKPQHETVKRTPEPDHEIHSRLNRSKSDTQSHAQDDNSLERVAQRIRSGSGSTPGYRVMITGEHESIDATGETIEIARILARHGKSIVIVNAEDGATNLADTIGLPSKPGVRELITGRASFEDVVQRDPSSSVQFIGTGDVDLPLEDESDFDNFLKAFDALDQIYDVIVVYAPKNAAQELFEEMEAAYDAGVVVESPRPPGNYAQRTDFIGFNVSGLDIIRYARPEKRTLRRLHEANVQQAGTA